MNYIMLFDFGLFALFVILLGRLLYKRRKDVSIQKILTIGGVPVIFLGMLRTTWGLDLMDRWAKKYGRFIRFLGYCSIGISFVAMGIGLFLMGLILVKLFTDPIQASIAPALPFTKLPVIGYLSFTHWIIIIAFIATIHEFAHGVVARSFGIRVKKSGIAILNLFLPIIPAAFVEPDEKQLRKNEPALYATIAAGPASNIVSAFIVLLALSFIFIPIQQQITEPVGFSMVPTNSTAPAAIEGFAGELIINEIDGVRVNDSSLFLTSLSPYVEGSVITLSGYNSTDKTPFTKNLTPVAHPTKENTGYIGATVSNNVDYTHKTWYTDLFAWFLKLFQLLFLFNLFVGILNMLPIAIADGGQIFMYLLDNGNKKNLGSRIAGIFTIAIVLIIIAGMISWAYFSFTGGFG